MGLCGSLHSPLCLRACIRGLIVRVGSCDLRNFAPPIFVAVSVGSGFVFWMRVVSVSSYLSAPNARLIRRPPAWVDGRRVGSNCA